MPGLVSCAAIKPSSWRKRKGEMQPRLWAAAGGSPLAHPFPVALIGYAAHRRSPANLPGLQPPFVGLGMSIRKGKTAARIMIRSRNVEPLGLVHGEGKGGVVDVNRIFIQQYPRRGGAGGAHAGKLAVGEPG